MNLRLHIETIVLDRTFATGDQVDVVRAAIGDEVLRLLRLHGVPRTLAAGGAAPVLARETHHVRPGVPPGALGVGIGRAVHESLVTFVPPAARTGR